MFKYGMPCGSICFLLLTGTANRGLPMPQDVHPSPLLTLRGHTQAIYRVQYSPDGQRLATASEDRTAGLWDAATGKRLLTLPDHSGAVLTVSFSPDGKRLAAGSWRGAVRIYDTATGRTDLLFFTS